MPCLLLGLFAWILGESDGAFDRYGASILGIFPFIIIFLVTSIATLRERTSGTLERLLALPVGKLDFLGGYALAFGCIAIVQALLATTVALYAFDLDVAGPQYFLLVVALASALLGSASGLFTSAFARSEFQAVQFLPAFIFPQLLLSGLLTPLDKLPRVLEAVAHCLPMTYLIDAMQRIGVEATPSGRAWFDVALLCIFTLVAITLGAATLRRKNP
jgi:ABC-2 type transport system permease protein